MSELEIVEAGLLTTIQDLGRPGLAHLGVPRSGAADRASLRLANRLVGNPEDAACLEATLTGPQIRAHVRCTVAITGATVEVAVSGRAVAMNAPMHLEAGDSLSVGAASAGLRSYVAFRGGIDCRSWFGSRSTDLLTGLGPPPLARGQRLRLGGAEPAFPSIDVAPVPAPEPEPRLGVIPGPRSDCFTATAMRLLVSEPFRVSPDSNRVGVRLEGPRLTRADGDDLRSEGMAHGALQVPPSGQPILLLADHPTTGGYPVIAVVRSADLPTAGQLRPGQLVRFFACNP